MRTPLTEFHGFSFADAVFLRHALVLRRLHRLDSNFDASDSMAAEPDRVAGALANGLANFILFELIFKALGLENSRKSLSSLTT